ncbi:hypothetical protein Tco_0237015 [Tanacetum coccineum]
MKYPFKDSFPTVERYRSTLELKIGTQIAQNAPTVRALQEEAYRLIMKTHDHEEPRSAPAQLIELLSKQLSLSSELKLSFMFLAVVPFITKTVSHHGNVFRREQLSEYVSQALQLIQPRSGTLPKSEPLPEVTKGQGTAPHCSQKSTAPVTNLLEYSSKKFLGFYCYIASEGNSTPYYDPIVASSSYYPNSIWVIVISCFSKEADSFLGLADDTDCLHLIHSTYDPEGDILILEAILK